MSAPRRVVLGLGSNLGDRLGRLREAVEHLRGRAELGLVATSPVYETAPVGGPAQPDYANAAALLVTAVDARHVLAAALAVEAALGRTRTPGERDGPRTIDIDVLWVEGEALDEPGFTVPHPRLAGRAFALRPLLDVVPDASDPRSGLAYASLPEAGTLLRVLARSL